VRQNQRVERPGHAVHRRCCLIYGMILRIYRLTSDPTQCEKCQDLLRTTASMWLQPRSHSPSLPQGSHTPRNRAPSPRTRRHILTCVPTCAYYHPLDPRTAKIQRSSPNDETPIANIWTPPHATPPHAAPPHALNVDRLVVAYHRTRPIS
jgi:hypothetical protein